MPAVRAGAILLHAEDPRIGWFHARLKKPNPAYVQYLKRLRGPKPPECVVPIGLMDGGPWVGGSLVPRYAPGAGELADAVDRTVFPDAEKVAFLGSLREHQDPAFAALTAQGHGLLIAGCGAGKTCIGTALVAHYDTPALVLVHTQDLADQWVESIRGFLGADVSVDVVGYGRPGLGESARIVVASLQTLARWGWWQIHSWAKRFGLVIVDEAHHTPAETFTFVLSGVSARHRFGLTATPDRADGLGDWLTWLCGPVAYQIPQEEMQASGRVMVPCVEFLDMPFIDMDDFDEGHERDRHLSEHVDRNERILTRIVELAAQGRKIIALGKLVHHMSTLANECVSRGLKAVALVGDVQYLPKKLRKEAIALMKEGHWDVVFATSLADEGLDAPVVDVCMLLHPEGNVHKVEQRIGRATRPLKGKPQPIVIDCRDTWGPYQGYARRRARLYRERGWL